MVIKMRLIDADSIHYTRLLSQQGLDMELVPKAVIDNTPTIDAEPVRHGRWYPGSSIITGGVRLINFQCCSNCGAESTEYAKYCPNCGAKMDMEVTDE